VKKLLLLVSLLSASLALGQTTTSITGTLKDLSNALVTSGQVTFTLRPSADTTMSGIARFSPQTITCLINSSGQIVSASSGTCIVTMNTALNPPGSYYLVKYCPYNVCTATFTFYAVLSSYDWSTVVPTPATSPAQNFVDIFSNQIIGGDKTFTGRITFSAVTSLNGACQLTVSWTAALTCAGGTGTIEVPVSSTIAPTTNTTIPSGVTLRFDGPACIPTTGFTFTVNGVLIAPPVQIFCGSGTQA
jgi:hypothetical protein